MIVRVLSVLAIVWALGFAIFMLTIPGPIEGTTTDAIVVPTGGAGRIDRGLALLRDHRAKRMLVTGVGTGVGPRDLAREYRASSRLFACCIDLGREAVDTRSNAQETTRWLSEHGYRTIRLVTSDWHVARATMELRAAAPRGTVVRGEGVPSNPRLTTLANEYDKLVLRRFALWLGAGR